MDLNLRLRLSTLMFLQFGIWGTWYVTMGTYLGQTLEFRGAIIGLAYSTTAIAAMISPFFVGMIADRFFPSQRILGVLHLLGGVMLFVVSMMVTPTAFLWLLVLYSICYMPTLALANALCFHHMTDPGRQFPGVRVLGTIGWIVLSFSVSLMGLEATAVPLQMAAGLSILTGAFCFFLPHTPPKAKGKKVAARDVLGLDALRLLKDKSFAVFIASSLLICIPLAFYYGFANLFLNDVGLSYAAAKMTLGQVSEIVFLLVMPFFFVRLGIKKMLLIGMAAWTIRYVFFAFGDVGTLVFMLYLGILLHGICYDFFFVAGQIYVDKKASPEIRSAAQGFLAFVTLGVGAFIGSVIGGNVVDIFTVEVDGETIMRWQWIWLTPAAMALLVMIGFGIFFDDRDVAAKAEDSEKADEVVPPEAAPAPNPPPAD